MLLKISKHIILLFFLSVSFLFYAQENRIKLNGTVKNDSIYLQDINIINKATNFGTSSNKNGEFELTAKLGDTILFSSIIYLNREIKITKTHINTKSLNVYLEQEINNLDEIMLVGKMSLELGKVALPMGAVLEKDEDYYKKPPDITHLTSPIKGRGISFIGVFNMLTSNLRNKRREKVEKQKQIEKLKENFSTNLRVLYQDIFFTEGLNIPEHKINLFLDYCEGNGLNEFYDSSEIEIKNFLVNQSKNFNSIKN